MNSPASTRSSRSTPSCARPYAETLSPPLPARPQPRSPDRLAKTAFSRSLRPRQDLSDLSAILGVAALGRRRLGSDDARRPHRSLGAAASGALRASPPSLDLPRLTPPLRPRLGSARRRQAGPRRAGRPWPTTQVLNGVHDSNASLLPHLASRKPPFTIVSTGTWVILMAVGLGVERLVAADDMLANVDVEGRPIACARFMGGREYSRNRRRRARRAPTLARCAAGDRLAARWRCRASPPQGGPSPSRKGEIRGEVAPGDRAALATLYVALMSDLMLTRLGADRGDLIVEGSFAANAAFAPIARRAAPRPARLSPAPTRREPRAARRCSRNGRTAASRPRRNTRSRRARSQGWPPTGRRGRRRSKARATARPPPLRQRVDRRGRGLPPRYEEALRSTRRRNEQAKDELARAEQSRAVTKAARERLTPLKMRVVRLLEDLPEELLREGLSLPALQAELRGRQGGKARAGEVAAELRRLGFDASGDGLAMMGS